MTKFHLATVLLALGGLAVLPACTSPSYYQTSSATPMPAASPAVSPGMVRQVQTALQQQGLYNGAIDGIWGPQTQSAVQRFQQSNSLSATGQLDTSTITALNLPSDNNAAPSQQSSITPPANTMNSPTSNGSTMPSNGTMPGNTNSPTSSTTPGTNGSTSAPPP
jgi:peptidoglycan hydrolase-like protein with peptidoglycan-binding domain